MTLTRMMFFFGLFLCNASAAEDFVIGVVPQFEAQRINNTWNPVLEELSRRTGNHFRLQGAASIGEFEQAFANGEYDFVYLNPWHAVIANETQGYQPILNDGMTKLRGVLVINKDSSVNEVADLDGMEIAFPSPNALGASLLMRADLAQIFKIQIKPVYVQTHSSVYLNVALGTMPAGGGVMGTFNELSDDVRNRIRILYETREMNPHPVSVHPRVEQEHVNSFVKAFLEISTDPETEKLLSDIPMLKPAPTTLDAYLMLRDWGLREFYVNE
jgi:phosphonate transport system substrate-binding protein